MITLFKIGIDVVMALFFFYLGIKAEENYPNLLGKLGSAVTWLKSLL